MDGSAPIAPVLSGICSRREVADYLEWLAGAVNDPDEKNAFARAARALNHLAPGRQPIDDGAWLQKALVYLENGIVKTENAALRKVAREMARYGSTKPRSHVERMRRHLRLMKKGSTE